MSPNNENAPETGGHRLEGFETNHQHGREFLMTHTTRTISPGVTATDLILEALRTGRPIAELLAEVGVV